MLILIELGQDIDSQVGDDTSGTLFFLCIVYCVLCIILTCIYKQACILIAFYIHTLLRFHLHLGLHLHLNVAISG